MLRKHLIDREARVGATPGEEPRIHWDEHEVTRLEGLTDGVFAIAIALLIVSLEVPRTFAELIAVIEGFGAFVLTFAVLMIVWYQHFRFFRRYGLQDTPTVVLNAVLLFVVLFYVYPLKFLYGWILGQLSGAPATVVGSGGTLVEVLPPAQAPLLMLLAGLGWLAGIAVFGGLYGWAYLLRDRLGLTPLEVFATQEELQNWVLAAGVTLAALGSLLIVPASAAVWTLGIYFLYFPLRAAHHRALRGRRQAVAARIVDLPAPTDQRPSPTQ